MMSKNTNIIVSIRQISQKQGTKGGTHFVGYSGTGQYRQKSRFTENLWKQNFAFVYSCSMRNQDIQFALYAWIKVWRRLQKFRCKDVWRTFSLESWMSIIYLFLARSICAVAIYTNVPVSVPERRTSFSLFLIQIDCARGCGNWFLCHTDLWKKNNSLTLHKTKSWRWSAIYKAGLQGPVPHWSSK